MQERSTGYGKRRRRRENRRKRKASKVLVTYADGSTEIRKPGTFRAPQRRHHPQRSLQWPQYQAYIDSPEWQEKRRAVLERDEHRCTRCGRRNGDRDQRIEGRKAVLHVHHLTYVRLGNESLGDLLVLCEHCHMQEHASR